MKSKIALTDVQDHETILLYGKPKVGKTWAYCSIIEKCIGAGGKVFLINTDGGVKRSMQEYFGDKFVEITKSINYYLISDVDEMEEIVADVKANVTPKDLIVIDLISDIWQFAQNKFMENLSGGKMVDYIERASRDKTKFGLLSGQIWQYVKKMEAIFTGPLVIHASCRVIAVASAKEIEIDRAFKNTEVTDRYDAVNEKPEGSRDLQYKFNSIIYIGEQKKQKIFIVLGDRGKFVDYQKVPFGRDFWKGFQEYRKTKEAK